MGELDAYLLRDFVAYFTEAVRSNFAVAVRAPDCATIGATYTASACSTTGGAGV